MDAYNKSISLAPSYAKAYSNRGLLFGKLREYNSALKDLNKAIELNPTYYKAFNNRGVVYKKSKELRKCTG